LRATTARLLTHGPRPRRAHPLPRGQAVIQNDPEKWQMMGPGALIGAGNHRESLAAVETTVPRDCRPLAVGRNLTPTASTLMVTVARWSVVALTDVQKGPHTRGHRSNWGCLLAAGI